MSILFVILILAWIGVIGFFLMHQIDDFLEMTGKQPKKMHSHKKKVKQATDHGIVHHLGIMSHHR